MSYAYIKAPPGYTLKRAPSLGSRARLMVSTALLTLGIAACTSVVYPMIVYQIEFAPRFAHAPREATVTSVPQLGNPVGKVEAAEAAPTVVPEMVNTSLDYTDSSTWFTGAPTPPDQAPYLVYSLSIPKLGITNAVVRTDHTDLKKSLIQYAGTAMPGDLGNTVIFGHSVLPQFFDPKNYITIFSTLHTLHPGDDIIVAADGATYDYKIADMYAVEPDNLSPLAQSYDGRYLTLITCTPPGTFLKRLIVRAVLQ